MEIKGIIFTTDALAAATIIIMFLLGISSIERQNDNHYSTHLIMDINTTSNALTDFYLGKETHDNLSNGIIESKVAKCNSVLEYENDNDKIYKEKVVKCTKLW